MYFYSHYISKLFKTIFQREAKYEQTKLQILVHFISPKIMMNTVSIVTGWYYKYIGDIHNYFKTFTTDSSGGTSALFFFYRSSQHYTPLPLSELWVLVCLLLLHVHLSHPALYSQTYASEGFLTNNTCSPGIS